MANVDFAPFRPTAVPPDSGATSGAEDAASVDGGTSVDGGAPTGVTVNTVDGYDGGQPLPSATTGDTFDDGPAPRSSIADNSAPPIDSKRPTLLASLLQYNPRGAWDAEQPRAVPPPPATGAAQTRPKVLSEAITTETTPAKAPTDQKPVKVNVGWISQYDRNVELRDDKQNIIPTEWAADIAPTKRKGTSPRDIACCPAAKEMLRRSGATLSGENIMVADAKDNLGRIVPNPARAKQAHDYIDSQMDSGKPVMGNRSGVATAISGAHTSDQFLQ